MKTQHTTLYRDIKASKLGGVCAGIADYTGINALWVRLGFIVSLFTPISAITVPAYILGWLLLSKKPPYLYRDNAEQKYW